MLAEGCWGRGAGRGEVLLHGRLLYPGVPEARCPGALQFLVAQCPSAQCPVSLVSGYSGARHPVSRCVRVPRCPATLVCLAALCSVSPVARSLSLPASSMPRCPRPCRSSTAHACQHAAHAHGAPRPEERCRGAPAGGRARGRCLPSLLIAACRDLRRAGAVPVAGAWRRVGEVGLGTGLLLVRPGAGCGSAAGGRAGRAGPGLAWPAASAGPRLKRPEPALSPASDLLSLL